MIAGISVVIPCHNDGAYLGEALRSVFAQTLAPQEIIVIDDGSTDDSRRVAEAFGARLNYQWYPHRGISASRNAGLAAARCDYLAFLDADDVWPEDSLALRFAACEQRPETAAALGLTREFLSPEASIAMPAARLGRDAIHVRLAGAMLVRRNAFDQLGGFDERLAVGEWIDWIDRFAQAGLGMAELPELVLRRRIHDGNLASATQPQWGDYLAMLRSALQRRAPPQGAKR